jgi:prepilin-type N-terminal cleavage/methylation domain-containing protein
MKLQKGFTLVELLVVITIIGILAAIALPNYTKVRIKGRETEVKANIHKIQEAIERYHLDEGEYPAYLLGGNENSWPIFFGRNLGDPVVFDLTTGEPLFFDPLIEYNYIDSYPENPFVDPQKAGIYMEFSGGDMTIPASGDPRFGIKGNLMPNSVDDPLWFSVAPGIPVETINQAGTQIVNFGAYGGHRTPSGDADRYIIQGSFFYRAEGDIDWTTPPGSSPTRYDFRYQSFERYILGGFGHDTTKGLDVIRLVGIGFYRHQPDTNFQWDIPLLLPEVFGGGNGGAFENMPYYPYEPSEHGVEFYYGAPDGYEDGVVIVLTDSGKNLNF